jgi:hypothetical protein
MGRGKKAQDAGEALFKWLYGVKPDTFETLHKNGGRPPKLRAEDKRHIALQYLREYRRMDSSAVEYGVCKGRVCHVIQWVEDTLVTDGTFALPGKKALKRKSESIRYIVGDVTETARKKDNKCSIRGKKASSAEDSGHR